MSRKDQVEAMEVKELEHQTLIRNILMDLHRAYSDDHIDGMGAMAATILAELTNINLKMAPPEAIALAMDQLRGYTKDEDEFRYLCGKLLMEVSSSIMLETGRAWIRGTVLGSG